VEKREERRVELRQFQAAFVRGAAPAKPREIPPWRGIRGNKKPALRPGSFLDIGGGVARRCKPISSTAEESRADPCSPPGTVGAMPHSYHDRAPAGAFDGRWLDPAPAPRRLPQRACAQTDLLPSEGSMIHSGPTLLSRLRHSTLLTLFVALMVIAKSGLACGCRIVDLDDDRAGSGISAMVASVTLHAGVAAPDPDPAPVDSSTRGGCKHCCCQQPSVSSYVIHVVSDVVHTANHLSLPARVFSARVTGPFRPPIRIRYP